MIMVRTGACQYDPGMIFVTIVIVIVFVPIVFVSTIAFDRAAFHGNVTFSIAAVPLKNRTKVFLKKIYFFRKLVSRLNIEKVQNLQ